MQVKVSPALVELLEVRDVDEQKEALVRLWSEVEKEVELRKKQNIVAPKRARFSFD